jgi:hypothetical protein
MLYEQPSTPSAMPADNDAANRMMVSPVDAATSC